MVIFLSLIIVLLVAKDLILFRSAGEEGSTFPYRLIGAWCGILRVLTLGVLLKPRP